MGCLIAIALVLVAVALSIVYSGPEESPAPTEVPTPAPTPSPTPTPMPTAHPVFDHATDGGLGPEIFEPSEFPGSVVSVDYRTSDYYEQTGECVKTMRVYLPYGYSEDQKYNVLILLHGSGGTEQYWFDEIRWYNDPDYLHAYECHLATVLDNMIANGLCEPVIVVSPTFYYSNAWRTGGDLTSRDGCQFRQELRNDILPALARNFSVYEIGDRDHYAFYGASHGAEVEFNGIISNDFDLFAWYGAISGYEGRMGTVERIWEEEGYGDLPLRYIYFSAGEHDYMAEDTISGYQDMHRNCSKVTEDNIEYVSIRDSEHEDVVWIDGVYNCLLKFFRTGEK